MPLDKDTYTIFENYAQSFPNKVNHNKPSSLEDVKKSTAATAGAGLDVKGQLSDKGEAHNTQVDVQEEDEQAPSHEDLLNMFDKAVGALKKHIAKAKHEQGGKREEDSEFVNQDGQKHSMVGKNNV